MEDEIFWRSAGISFPVEFWSHPIRKNKDVMGAVVGERQGNTVRVFVMDHGPGVPPEERQRIFDVFYRGASRKKVTGSGIGLSTVQKIARLYEGHAWVEETSGGGATFKVEFQDE